MAPIIRSALGYNYWLSDLGYVGLKYQYRLSVRLLIQSVSVKKHGEVESLDEVVIGYWYGEISILVIRIPRLSSVKC